MKSIFDKAAYQEVIERLASLEDGSKGLWGKMSVGQMVWHCQVPVRLAIENKKSRVGGNPIVRWFFKKALYNDTPWRKNLPTLPIARATEEKDFISEREKLLGMLAELYNARDRKDWNPHPLFGSFTAEQWGQMQYKHLDHHLRQFGV